MASYSLVFVVVLLVASSLMLRRTKNYWLKLLFPLGSRGTVVLLARRGLVHKMRRCCELASDQGQGGSLTMNLGYFLYARTRLGYRFHLYQLGKRRPLPHSITQPISLPGVTVVPIPILDDNYAYLVIDTVSNMAVVVDPSDAEAVKRSVRERNVNLTAVLTTHKHWDHAGGNEALKKEFPRLAVYGGAMDNVPGATQYVLPSRQCPLQDKAIVKVGRLTFEAMWTPGHTVGHMVYMLQMEPPCLFTGDHIFVGGCGRMFEGDSETMLRSLKRISELPKNSLIFPGHEYAWLNMKFSSTLQPALLQVQNKWQWVKQQRAHKLAAIPSILSEELKYNLFLCPRLGGIHLKDALGLPHHCNDSAVLAELRKRKDA